MLVQADYGFVYSTLIRVEGVMKLRENKLGGFRHHWSEKYFALNGAVLRCYTFRKRKLLWRGNVESVMMLDEAEGKLVVRVSGRSGVQLQWHVAAEFTAWMKYLDIASMMYLKTYYKLHNAIGSGGFGVVYCGEDRKTGKPVAVKKISLLRRDMRATVEKETAFRFDSPYLIHLYDVFEENYHVYIVMELGGKDTLETLLWHQRKLKEKHAAVIIAAVLRGVQHLHHLGIAHRDIKPDNVLLKQTVSPFDAKLCDFGLARQVVSITSNSDQQKTLSAGTEISYGFIPPEQKKGICGTAGYAAPEMLEGRDYGVAVDLWSIGVLVYRMLSGFELTPANSFRSAAATLRTTNPTTAGGLHGPQWNGISSQAKDFVMKLLRKNPHERITASQALAHPWILKHITNSNPPQPPLHHCHYPNNPTCA